jgi:hypothetical protein
MLSYHRNSSNRQIKCFTVWTLIFASSLLNGGCVLGQDKKQNPDVQPKQEIKYSQDPDAAKHMTLLLKDFDPKPMLHTAVHETPRAKFPVIDVHNHVNDPGGVHGEEIAPAEVVRRMDRANVQKIVILTGMWGDKLQSVLDKMVKPYPDRLEQNRRSQLQRRDGDAIG